MDQKYLQVVLVVVTVSALVMELALVAVAVLVTMVVVVAATVVTAGISLVVERTFVVVVVIGNGKFVRDLRRRKWKGLLEMSRQDFRKNSAPGVCGVFPGGAQNA